MKNIVDKAFYYIELLCLVFVIISLFCLIYFTVLKPILLKYYKNKLEKEKKSMSIIILILGIITSLCLCGLTPDNANLYICLFCGVITVTAILFFKKLEEKNEEESLRFLNKEDKTSTLKIKKKQSKLIYLITIVVFSIATIISSCLARVETGHTGILVTFGKVEDRTYEAGIVLKPLWSRMVQIDNRIQKNGHDDKAISLEAFTIDTQKVNIQYTVNYKLNKENASKLYKEVGENYFTTLLIPIIQESVKNECAKYTADEFLSKRADIAKNIEEDVKRKFATHYIELTATAIEDLGFSDEYEKAVEDKQKAKQEKLKAEQDAEKKKIEADANAYQTITKAKAEAEANKLKEKSITPNLIEYEMIQKWNGILPQVEGGGNPIIDMRKKD